MAMSDYDLSDLAAVMNGENGNGFGNGGWWILLLFILLGGWNGNGYGGRGGAGNIGGNELYPWLENQSAISNGFASVTQAITGGFANAETAATARQMADMQQSFALQQQLAQCCCDNRLATANLSADIAREACADRAAVSDGIRDVLTNQNANAQRILDQMCQDKLDAKNDEIANLRQQVNMMNLAASQNLQTAQLMADNAAQTNALEQYLAPVPRPAYVVQNPNCCQQWQGCGCN